MAQRRKLPVIETVAASYRFFFTHLGRFLFVTLGWAGAVFVLGFALIAGAEALMQSAADPAADPNQTLPILELVGAILALIIILAGFAIVVAWHRLIIGKRAPKPSRFGTALLYAGRLFLLTAIAPAAFVLLGVLPATIVRRLDLAADLKAQLAPAFMVLGVLIAIAITVRLSLVLPATAVRDSSLTFVNAWRLTRGNALRMLAGTLLATGPYALFTLVQEFYLRSEPDIEENSALTLTILGVTLLLTIAGGLIQAGFLSFAYLFFTEGEIAPSPVANEVAPVPQHATA